MATKISWNGQGGELDSAIVEGDEYEGALTEALIKMVKGQIITPGDTFTFEEVQS